MNILLGLLVVGFIGSIIYLTLNTQSADRRREYLRNLKDFLEGQVEIIDGDENSFRIKFFYKQKEFMYEDIQEHGFGDRVEYRGFLKVKTETDLILGFTEREKSTLRDTMNSLQDEHSPWKQNAGKIMLPPELNRFNVYTNNPDLVARLMADEKVVNTFARFINMDARGHPVMSLEILGGMGVLRFYLSGGFKPSVYDLQENYTAIEPYLELMTYIAERTRKIKEELDLLK